ncbi:MAG: extracellular solute-binding protein, partial [Sulfolobales archaeon]
GTGHDIVQLILFDAAIFGELLEPVDDVVREVENRSGPWMPVARYVAQIGGRWLAVPWYHYSTPATINKRYWESIGLQPRHVARLSWEELFEAAQQLNKLGHPIAMTLGQTFDAQEGTHTLLYSYGARPVDESGRITIESDETAAALEYVKRLFPFMPREILGWDDASNNQFMLSGRGSWVHNGPSIWAVAKLQQLPIAELLDHVPMPRGPKGRYRLTRTLSLGIWKFSKNKDLAKELISHLLHPENFARQVEASMGYNQPLLSKLSSLPYWLRQSVLRYYEPPSEQVVVPGWPGPVGRGAQLAYTSFIIPIMFAKVATGELSVKEAMRWAAQELRVRYQQG